MAWIARCFRWRLKPRETRMVIYLLVLLGIVGWKFAPRPWRPALTLETPRHLIYSTATRRQTEDIARVLQLLYGAYSNRFGGVAGFAGEHGRLKVKLFKDRAEFRAINPGLGWAEAFYRKPYCRAYYSAEEVNPYHWMLHEAVHQLNGEAAHLRLEKWLEEGLATYFSTSRLTARQLAVGSIDPNTYPVWWMGAIATSPDLAENIKNGSVIPLRSIITNRGGPSLNRQFNLYYLHWWTLTYFLFETPRYAPQALTLAERGGGWEAFAQTIGPVEQVQAEWHAYVRRLKAALSGTDLEFFRSGKLL